MSNSETDPDPDVTSEDDEEEWSPSRDDLEEEDSENDLEEERSPDDPAQEVIDPDDQEMEQEHPDPCHLYVLGANDCGQLGTDPLVVNAQEFPGLCEFFQTQNQKILAIAAGAMHSCVVTVEGFVYTFGCNDDGALGRSADEEEACATPGQVTLPGEAIQVTAGDSHSAALLEDGTVYCWGTFKDVENNEPCGLVPSDCDVEDRNELFHSVPVKVPLKPGIEIQAIASGFNHVTLLTRKRKVITFGAWDQILGRPIAQTRRATKLGLKELRKIWLTPTELFPGGRERFVQIWSGSNSTFCKEKSGRVWAFGMNNARQLGFETRVKPEQENELISIHRPETSPALNDLTEISVGKFHCLGLDGEGQAFAWGQPYDGQLGLGDATPCDPIAVPTRIEALSDPVTHVYCGNSVSYAVTENRQLYAWGSGVNLQLGNTGGDEDSNVPRPVLTQGEGTPIGSVRGLSIGGQHTLLLLRDPEMDTS